MTAKTGLARTKPAIFGVPSLETARAIDDSDKAAGLQAAHFRCKARLHELEAQFEAKASEIRAAFVAECAGDLGGHGMTNAARKIRQRWEKRAREIKAGHGRNQSRRSPRLPADASTKSRGT